MIIGKDDVIRYIEFNKAPYWKIKSTVGGKVKFSVLTDEEQSDDESETTDRRKGTARSDLGLDQSIDYLRQALAIITPGDYIITASVHNRGGKNTLEENFRIPGASTAPALVGSHLMPPGSDYVARQDMEAAIERAVEKITTQATIKALEDKIKILENGDGNTAWDRVISRIEKTKPGLTGDLIVGVAEVAGIKVKQTAVGVSGFNDKDLTEEEITRRFQECQEKIDKALPDIGTLKVLEKLAALAETDPDKLKMGYNML